MRFFGPLLTETSFSPWSAPEFLTTGYLLLWVQLNNTSPQYWLKHLQKQKHYFSNPNTDQASRIKTTLFLIYCNYVNETYFLLGECDLKATQFVK